MFKKASCAPQSAPLSAPTPAFHCYGSYEGNEGNEGNERFEEASDQEG